MDKFEEFCPVQKIVELVFAPEENNNFPEFKKKSINEQLFDSKNYMSIYGKMSSKTQL